MGLRLSEIANILRAEVLVGHDKIDLYVDSACASDLMSDLLSADVEGTLLITGLNSIQVIKTAVISNISAVVLVRAKEPLKEVLDEARRYNLPFLSTPFTMYTACGRLFKNGLRGVEGRGAPFRKKI